MEQLLAWHNLIFYIPIVFGLLVVIGMALGIAGDSDHDVDHDVDHDLDLDHDVDLAHGVDHDFDHDHDLDHDADHDHGHAKEGPSVFVKALAFVGVGKVPLNVVMMMAGLLFGGLGIICNTILEPLLKSPGVFMWISLPVAFFGMTFLTGAASQLIGRLMPTSETYIVTKHSLAGCRGNLTLKAGPEFGTANISDREGNIHSVRCRTRGEDIPKGTPVLVVDYDQETDFYLVVKCPMTEAQEEASASK